MYTSHDLIMFRRNFQLLLFVKQLVWDLEVSMLEKTSVALPSLAWTPLSSLKLSRPAASVQQPT